MNKRKQKRRFTNFADKITLQNLKYIIVICLVLSFLCEFVPSIVDICKFFNYNWLIVLLQPHKDFFINIILGFLGSAVISYIMLLIPEKIKRQEEREKISVYIKDVVSDFLILLSFIEFGVISKNIEDVKLLDEDIEIRKENLYKSIRNIVDYYEMNDVDNKLLDEIMDIVKNKLLVIIGEIDNFLSIHKSFENTNVNFEYPVNIYNDIFRVLYENLNEKYCLNEIKDKFTKIVPYEVVAFKDLKQVKYSIEKYKETSNNIQSNSFYISKLYSIYSKFGNERVKNILEER